MPEETAEKTEEQTVEEVDEEEVEEVDEEAAIDVEEEEDLEDKVERQQEQIKDLQGQLMDLSARVADDGGTGVCSDCNGPVIKTSGFMKKPKIKCRRCGRVYHEYQ